MTAGFFFWEGGRPVLGGGGRDQGGGGGREEGGGGWEVFFKGKRRAGAGSKGLTTIETSGKAERDWSHMPLTVLV